MSNQTAMAMYCWWASNSWPTCSWSSRRNVDVVVSVMAVTVAAPADRVDAFGRAGPAEHLRPASFQPEALYGSGSGSGSGSGTDRASGRDGRPSGPAPDQGVTRPRRRDATGRGHDEVPGLCPVLLPGARHVPDPGPGGPAVRLGSGRLSSATRSCRRPPPAPSRPSTSTARTIGGRRRGACGPPARRARRVPSARTAASSSSAPPWPGCGRRRRSGRRASPAG